MLGNHPDHVVSITFDDAYCSVLEYALPALRALGWPATVFAPTANVASGRPMTWLGEGYAERKRQLTWAELSVLAGGGLGDRQSRAHPSAALFARRRGAGG